MEVDVNSVSRSVNSESLTLLRKPPNHQCILTHVKVPKNLLKSKGLVYLVLKSGESL